MSEDTETPKPDAVAGRLDGLVGRLCTKCNQPPESVGRGDGCIDSYCPYREQKMPPTKIKSFPGAMVEHYRKNHDGELPCRPTQDIPHLTE